MKTICTYCETEFNTEWYNVCDSCMENIVKPCQELYEEKPKKKKKNKVWENFREEVWVLTENVKHKIPGIEKRGFYDHHIDHKYSIWQGFLDGKSTKELASLDNLQMLPYKQNISKGIRCE